MAVAVPIGLVAGYYRGWIDPVISRVTDVLLAFPFLILAVGLGAILGPSLLNATLAIGIAAAPQIIRVARGETLALREEDYVRAAIANGASDAVILGRHIVPNMLNTLLVLATVTIPQAIIGEATLSFLGLGVQPPTPSWGVMLSDAQSYLTQAPRLAVYPGLAIFLCSLSFNLLGDGLRDALDPRTRRCRCHCSTCETSPSASRPTTGRHMPSTGCRSRSRPARCSASSVSPAAARA
jgi:peptide/nickel transport system permease protein